MLNEALAEGRLTAEEHSERLDSIYAAKTQADLVPLLEDLPAPAASSSAVAVTSRAPEKAYHGGPIVAISAERSARDAGGSPRPARW